MRPMVGVLSSLVIGAFASVAALASDHPKLPAGWELALDATWVDPRLVREGFVPLTYDSRTYYCRLDATPRLGSRLNSGVFCGDADTVQSLYNAGRRVVLHLY